MKNEEDEAFDELAKRQGSWGGGFPAKRKMAADKLQEPAQEFVACTDERMCVPCYTGQGICESNPPLPIQLVREWVGLTNDEVNTLWDEWKDGICLDYKTWAQVIEAKIKDKNT